MNSNPSDKLSVFYISLFDETLPEDDPKKTETCPSTSRLYAKVYILILYLFHCSVMHR